TVFSMFLFRSFRRRGAFWARSGLDFDGSVHHITTNLAHLSSQNRPKSLKIDLKWYCFFDEWVCNYFPNLDYIFNDKKCTDIEDEIVSFTTIDNTTNPIEEVSSYYHEYHNEDATIEALSNCFQHASLISFLGHGKWYPEHYYESELICADGSLKISKLRLLETKTNPFIALGACEGSVNSLKELKYEAKNFSNWFLQAGARGVLANLWAVTSQSVHDIYSKTFEIYFHEKCSMAQAHRKALIAYRDGNIQWHVKNSSTFLFLNHQNIKPENITNDLKNLLNDCSQPIHWAAGNITGNA
ncbi:MAG: CHAT domain-containing protein, partial [Pseudomonadota bacterium]